MSSIAFDLLQSVHFHLSLGNSGINCGPPDDTKPVSSLADADCHLLPLSHIIPCAQYFATCLRPNMFLDSQCIANSLKLSPSLALLGASFGIGILHTANKNDPFCCWIGFDCALRSVFEILIGLIDSNDIRFIEVYQIITH